MTSEYYKEIEVYIDELQVERDEIINNITHYETLLELNEAKLKIHENRLFIARNNLLSEGLK
jgi:predicted DNA-binding protein YlxM (UPF0122 family)